MAPARRAFLVQEKFVWLNVYIGRVQTKTLRCILLDCFQECRPRRVGHAKLVMIELPGESAEVAHYRIVTAAAGS